jgi:hypothetical protein
MTMHIHGIVLQNFEYEEVHLCNYETYEDVIETPCFLDSRRSISGSAFTPRSARAQASRAPIGSVEDRTNQQLLYNT